MLFVELEISNEEKVKYPSTAAHAELLADNIARNYDPKCPNNHVNHSKATVVLGIEVIGDDSRVCLISIKNSCCAEFSSYLVNNLKNDMRF